MKIKAFRLLPAILTGALLISIAAACSSKTQKDGTDEATCDETEGKFTTDSVYYADSVAGTDGFSVIVKFGGQYPGGEESPVVDSIRLTIAQMLSTAPVDKFTPPSKSLLSNGQALVDSTGRAAMRDMQEEWDGSWGMENMCTFRPIFINDIVITYWFENYIYGGGAHGFSANLARSYDRSTGRQFTWDEVIPGGMTPQLRELILSGLWMQYFNKDKDQTGNINDVLQLVDGKLELPSYAPQIMPHGIRFSYGEYEIAAYCWGEPSCLIPYSSLKPFLSKKMQSVADKNTADVVKDRQPGK